MTFPDDLRYSPSHMWARLEQDGTVTVGISDFAQNELGDIQYIGLPRLGSRVTKDQALGEAESNKTVSELISPCSGEITAINNALSNDPTIVNGAPYAEGWIAKISPNDAEELGNLLDATQYAEVVASEAH